MRIKKAFEKKHICELTHGFLTPKERFQFFSKDKIISKVKRKHPVHFDLKKLTKEKLIEILLAPQWWPQNDFPVLFTRSKTPSKKKAANRTEQKGKQ